VEVRELTSQLIAFKTDQPEGIRLCAGFIQGWLESNGIETTESEVRGLPVLMATAGEDVEAESVPTILLHGHIDVVPARDGQFEARVEDDRLYGRGGYDMKGALAAMMLALVDLREVPGVRVMLGIVPDEEAEEEVERGTNLLVEGGFTGDFAVTGEPTDMHIGVQAKGVLALRIEVEGRAAHGSTPWLGDNAILRAHDVFRSIESLPFSRQSSELFDRPSINLGRILGGDALNKVPDSCVIDVDIRHLPEQDPKVILDQIREIPGARVEKTFTRPPVRIDPDLPFVKGLCRAADPYSEREVRSVGRDGASDAVSFIRAGIPAVEFGPIGAGHHGPEEWVSLSSLTSYRQVLRDFVTSAPMLAGGGS
jgi:succinyl-diaminopimelate desuccinylase